jgi:3-deoxy-D-manno-octulosonate 8-phosphate phosphatase (KDO 8-P phosphatase)
MSIQAKLRKVKMLILDVDGVLTDGRIWLNSKEEWVRQFNVRDGVGIRLLLKKNFKVAVISGGDSKDVRKRLEFLGVPHCFFGVENKEEIFHKLLQDTHLTAEECVFVGDDIYDIPLIERVGVAFTVANAVDEVLDTKVNVTKRAGGHGAVREVIDLIIKHAEFFQGGKQI